MRLSFKTSPQHTSWSELAAMWREADAIPAYDAGWTFDHFYPLGGDGSGPCLEGWTVTTALTALTTRLRVGVMVLGNTYRHPAVLANMAATLDQISGGRLELGIGAGWHEEEHAAYGIDLPPLRERFDRFEEALEVIHLLLTTERADFTGQHYRLTNARCEPKSIQVPRVPFVVGGKGERRTLRIAARWADQWNLPGGEPEELARLRGVLEEHCAAVGRDPGEIEVSVQFPHQDDPAATAELGARYVEAGARHLIVFFSAPYEPRILEPVAAALKPVLGG